MGIRTGGRQKGSLNRTTAALKDMVLNALDDAGGLEYLTAQAKKNPKAFLALVSKLLPRDVVLDATVKVRLEEIISGKRDES